MITAILLAMLASPQPVAAVATTSSGKALICHREPVLGSRLKHRKVCMTAAEWNSRQDGNARAMSEFVTRNLTSQPPPAVTGQ